MRSSNSFSGSCNWAKDDGYPGTTPPLVEGLVKEMHRVGAAIVKHYLELHKAILDVPPTDGEFKNPISRSLSIILGNIENDILMAAKILRRIDFSFRSRVRL